MNIKNAKKTFEALEKNNHAQHLVQQQQQQFAWDVCRLTDLSIVSLLYSRYSRRWLLLKPAESQAA